MVIMEVFVIHIEISIMVYSSFVPIAPLSNTSEVLATIKSKMMDEEYKYNYLAKLSQDPIAALEDWRLSMTKDWHSIVDAKEMQHDWKEHVVRYAYMQSLAQ